MPSDDGFANDDVVSPPLSDVAFGQGNEILVLREVDGTTDRRAVTGHDRARPWRWVQPFAGEGGFVVARLGLALSDRETVAADARALCESLHRVRG